MCGINGIVGLKGIDAEKCINEMNMRLSHRGPDAQDFVKFENAAFGHARLSIIDLDARSNQPMMDSSGRYCLVFNGEIYNYKQVKSWLKDYQFITEGDTEVVLAAYLKWGKDSLTRFNGMFAFAVYDTVERTVFIARDRMGIKPLYYHLSANRLLFSSEIRPIIHSGLIDKKIDKDALLDYVRYQTVHAPSTIIEGVKMLMPGHYIFMSDSEFTMDAYYDVRNAYVRHSHKMGYEDIKTEVRNKLSSAVETRMVADVDFGAFLSGGIDSSAIVALMSRHASNPINTFSITFDEDKFSEAKYAKIIADKYQTNHHEIKLSASHFIEELPNALSAMDHPSGDGPNTYVVSGAVRKEGIKMAMSGLGGDELFAGYDVFQRSLSLLNKKWVMSFPPPVRKLIAKPYKWSKKSVAGDKFEELLMLDYWDVNYTYPVSRKVQTDGQTMKLLDLDGISKNEVFRICSQWIGYGTPGFEVPDLSKVSLCEINTYLQNVLLRDSDQMSMAHGLELRVPFMDHQLIESVIGIKDEYKYPSTPKRLLVDALGDLLPSEIVDRPKMGFTFPWEVWMQNELAEFTTTMLEGLKSRDWMDEKELTNMYDRFKQGDKRYTWSRIWYLLVLEDWLQKNGIDE